MCIGVWDSLSRQWWGEFVSSDGIRLGVGLRVRTCRRCEMCTRGRQPHGKFLKAGYIFPSD